MALNAAEPEIDSTLVRELLRSQFPHWADLCIVPVSSSGWCNVAFRLGEQMVVRLPRHRAYVDSVNKEHFWLPRLTTALPCPIPTPLAIGEPGQGYPWPWLISQWIDGEIATPERIGNLSDFAIDLGRFLNALHHIDLANGPAPGAHNFYRGGALQHYDSQARQALRALAGKTDTNVASDIWEKALATTWSASPVWIHGDISVGNLLVRNGRLHAVIDFGNVGVGDPACDLAMAWTLFEGDSRDAFQKALFLDDATWARGRGWVLWKAMIIAAGISTSNAFEASQPFRVIDEVIADHRCATAR
jgi:aminoglycoside phosphotransferase (APT) family kinase protein